MKKAIQFGALFALLMSLKSCDVIGDIFQAGVWSGVIIALIIIVLIVFIVSRMRRRE